MGDGFGNEILGGQETLIRSGIRSGNYVPNGAGWRIVADGSAEFNNATIRGRLQLGGDGSAGHPGITMGATPPAGLVAYYAAGTPETVTAPETIVSVDLNSDGHGNISYEAMVIDSGAVPLSSQVYGTIVAGTVREFQRIVLNPSDPTVTLTALYRNELFLEADVVGVDVLAVGLTTDQFGRCVIDTGGLVAFGPGGAANTDTEVYRAAPGVLAADAIKANKGGAAETWHQLPLSNGWTQNYVNNYRLVPSPANSVQIRASFFVPAGARGDATVISNLPAPYRPAVITDLAATCDAQILGKSPHFSINTNGDVTCWGLSNSTLASISEVYALDA